MPSINEAHTYGKPLVHRELKSLRSIRDRTKTVGGRMLASSVELQQIVDDEEQEIVKKYHTGVSNGGIPFKRTVLLPMAFQRNYILRCAQENKELDHVDLVDERVRCDSYDEVISPEQLYLSETKKFMKDDDAFAKTVSVYMYKSIYMFLFYLI